MVGIGEALSPGRLRCWVCQRCRRSENDGCLVGVLLTDGLEPGDIVRGSASREVVKGCGGSEAASLPIWFGFSSSREATSS